MVRKVKPRITLRTIIKTHTLNTFREIADLTEFIKDLYAWKRNHQLAVLRTVRREIEDNPQAAFKIVDEKINELEESEERDGRDQIRSAQGGSDEQGQARE